VLTSRFPPELIDRVVAEAGRTQQRERLLPARVVVWLVLAMALFSGQAYEEVARLLAGGLGWARRWQQWFRVPSTPAIAKARARLGAEPLARLFVEVARPLASPDTTGAWYRGWRLLAVDGTTVDVADTPANDQAFGRPKTHRGEQTAFPQVRVVAVAECGTHAIIDAAMGPLAKGETTLAAGLLGKTAHSARRRCCWPTASSSTPTSGARRPPPARGCCGAPGPTRCCRCCKPSRTGPT
jgi:hypothetical protein